MAKAKLISKEEVGVHKKELGKIVKSLQRDGIALAKILNQSLKIIRQLERPRRDYSK